MMLQIINIQKFTTLFFKIVQKICQFFLFSYKIIFLIKITKICKFYYKKYIRVHVDMDFLNKSNIYLKNIIKYKVKCNDIIYMV